jgi:FkbM family methyltransferase
MPETETTSNTEILDPEVVAGGYSRVDPSVESQPRITMTSIPAFRPLNVLARRLNGLRAVWPFDNRWQLILDRMLFRGTGLAVYRMNGREILVDHRGGDENGTRLCLVSDMYKKYLRVMKFSGPINVLDLGANGGGFPLMLVLAGIPLKRVVCVEMNPQTFTRLQFNIARNVQGDHRVINAAVCGTRRTLDLVLGSGSTGDSLYAPSVASKGEATRSGYSIAGVTLDDVLCEEFDGAGTVDLCKLDVEGAEYEILFSPSHSLIKKIRYLILEVHPNPSRTKEELLAKLTALGFLEIRVDVDDELDVHLLENAGLSAGCVP